MKVGDLVKWTHPEAPDIGIILKAGTADYGCGGAHIYWFSKPEHSGTYPMVHDLLEMLSESR